MRSKTRINHMMYMEFFLGFEQVKGLFPAESDLLLLSLIALFAPDVIGQSKTILLLWYWLF